MTSVGGDEGVRAPGWYLLRCRPNDEPRLLSPALTPDYGDGFRYANRLCLKTFVSRQGRLNAVIRISHPMRRFAFDGGDPDVGGHKNIICLQSIGRARAAAAMIVSLARRKGLPWLIRGLAILVREGVREFGEWLYTSYRSDEDARAIEICYEEWLRRYDRVPVLLGGDVGTRPGAPKVSVVLPVYNTSLAHLTACIGSVIAQSYPHWELCIADDASTDPRIPEYLSALAVGERRITMVRRECNGNISAATNSALALASGEIVALIDHDDLLHPDALGEIASAFAAHPEWALVFTDEDKIGAAGRRQDPYFKPSFNPDLLCTQNSICHLMAFRRTLAEDIGGFRSECDGSQDWDFALRASERLGAHGVGHVPRVLYHWRKWEGSTAVSSVVKPYARDAALRAVSAHLARTCRAANVGPVASDPDSLRVRYPLPAPLPTVCVILGNARDDDALGRSIASIQRTHGQLACGYLIGARSGVERGTSQVPFSQCVVDVAAARAADRNELAASSTADILLFVDAGVEAIAEGWLEELVAQASRPEVAIAGPKLFYPNGRIHNAGVFLGGENVATDAYHDGPGTERGHMNRARLVQNLSAVSPRCLAMRRSVYLELGGFDASLLVHDATDMCLKAWSSGYRVVWTPFAELLWRGSDAGRDDQSRLAIENAAMLERWKRWIDDDPAWNPNLSLPPSGLAFPPRRAPF